MWSGIARNDSHACRWEHSAHTVAHILVAGPDAALIEGVAQTLAAAGHRVEVARSISEAMDVLGGSRPLIAVVDRSELFSDGTTFRIPLAQGGALIAFHVDDSERTPLPFPIQRTMLATLQLPLERQRLVALVRNVEVRAQAAGRVESIGFEEDPGIETTAG